MRWLATLTIPALIGLGGCAQTPAQRAAAAERAAADQAGLAKELAGLVPEKSGGCLSEIDSRNARTIKAYGPTIVYVVNPTLKFRTDTTGGCERIARGDILVTVSHTGQLCRGDIGRTVDQASRFTSGSCGFGDFVRYSKPDR